MADTQPTFPQPEEWRPIAEYEGHYEVSNYGRVRSLDREYVDSLGKKRKHKGKILKPFTLRGGHHRVTLWKKNRSYRTQVHRIVLTTFVGPRPPGMECRHLDGNPINNHVDNLAWGTSKENKEDIARHGTNARTNKTHCPRGHELVTPNLVVSAWEKRGWRECRACGLAQSRISYHKHEKTRFVEIAHEKYKQIMS